MGSGSPWAFGGGVKGGAMGRNWRRLRCGCLELRRDLHLRTGPQQAVDDDQIWGPIVPSTTRNPSLGSGLDRAVFDTSSLPTTSRYGRTGPMPRARSGTSRAPFRGPEGHADPHEEAGQDRRSGLGKTPRIWIVPVPGVDAGVLVVGLAPVRISPASPVSAISIGIGAELDRPSARASRSGPISQQVVLAHVGVGVDRVHRDDRRQERGWTHRRRGSPHGS